VLDVAAARVARPALDAFEDLLQRQAVGDETRGIHDDLVLLREPAPDVHLRDAGDGAQARCDIPVEDGPPLHGRETFALDGEHVDLAEPGGDGPHLGITEAWRDRLASLREPLVHELAGEVDVHVVLEHDRDGRETVAGDRPDLHQVGQPVHRRFDGVGHELLHLHRAEGGGLREHLHLDVRDVRDGVDRKQREGVGPAQREQDGADQDDGAVLEAPVDQAAQHLSAPLRARPWRTRT
jgi:hypothetical protein